MYKNNQFKFSDIISVISNPEEGPLNLNFRREELNENNRAHFMGPGIYLISYCSEVIYIGKYQPLNKGNILKDRWIAHLQTITMRGSRVGFGRCVDTTKKLNGILNDLTNAQLSEKIRQMHINPFERSKRFKDTGVVTSINRVAFAVENWDSFSQVHDSKILKNFEFRLLRLEGLDTEVNAKKCISFIEKRLLSLHKPRINKEYKKEIHLNQAALISIDTILKELGKILENEFSGVRLSGSTILSG